MLDEPLVISFGAVFLSVWSCVKIPRLVQNAYYGMALLHAITIGIAGRIWWLGWVEIPSSRPCLLLAFPICALMAWLLQRSRIKGLELLLVLPRLAALGYVCVLIIRSSFVVLSDLEMEERKYRSPDGRYDAVVIEVDGFDDSYQKVALRPRILDWGTAFDFPQTYIWNLYPHGYVSRVFWSSSRQLNLVFEDRGQVVSKIENWHGIHIRYLKIPSTRPKALP